MTVRELVEKLEAQHKPDAEVVLWNDATEECDLPLAHVHTHVRGDVGLLPDGAGTTDSA